ncbi:MAG: hypothetical protein K8R60_24235 [Burkholderiales bacterium]|nr:hypothetical protein [Burkholderiales bacterium]
MSLFSDLTPQAAGHGAAPARRRPIWATSAIDGAADTSPMDLSTLGAHVDRCNGSRERMFGLRCAADALSGFLAPRVVTTLVALAIVFGVGSLLV